MKKTSFIFLSVVITLIFNNAIVYAGPHWTHEEQLGWGEQ